MPGKPTRFDYQSLDAAANRLYVAHMGDGTVAVVDLAAGKVVSELTSVPRATGVLVVPTLQRVFVSAAGAGQVVAFDTRTLREVGRVSGTRFPDGLAYDPGSGRVLVSDEVGDDPFFLRVQVDHDAVPTILRAPFICVDGR